MYNKIMFESNLSKLRNERLINELRNIPLATCTGHIAFVNSPDGDVVFLKGDIPVEDPNNPIGYVKSLITDKMKSFNTNDIIISVGFGVGYILDELFNSTKSKIVIYEPDIKYLRFIFETIDLTPYITTNRVCISDSIEECVDFILKHYINEDKIDFVLSEILAIFYKNDYEKFSEILYSKLKSKIIDINTIKVLSKKWVENVIKFINYDSDFYSIEDLKWKFSGKTALILGAGPSLADNIEKIKANRNSYTIFAVNRVLEFLEQNNIVPDFAVFSDAKDIKDRYNLSNEYTSKLNIIKDWKSEAEIAKFKCKNLFIYFSDNEIFLDKYSKDLQIQLLPSEQTTTIVALMCANFMDFTKIYLCGFDLAFKENQVYATGDEVNVNSNTAIIDKSKKQIVNVPSIKGKMVQTREDYSIFIKTMETIIKTKGLKNLYNITDFGAYIEGMNYISFDAINFIGMKNNLDNEIQQLKYCKKDFKKYLDIEKTKMLEIHDKINTMTSINIVLDKIKNTTLLYEYLQFELLEFSREGGSTTAVDKLYSKTILALDKLLAMI